MIFFHRRKVTMAFHAMLTPTGMNILLREGQFIGQTVSFLMFLVYASSCSLFYYTYFDYMNIEILGLSKINFFILVAGLVIVLPLLKKIICRYLAYLMQCHATMHQILVTSSLYNFSAGLILIPILFLAMFSTFHFFFHIGMCMLLINYIMCFFRILFIGFSDKKLKNIYFIIYLCTLKIIPAATIVIFVVKG